jgi:NarL family two-component system sensor histidine kinase LiaS
VAADAWSHGEFSASINDPAVDELGQLATDLNRMALQLQNLLRDQQQLAVMEERNRLARDLHDSVKQQIFAVTMLVGSAQMEVGTNSEAQRILAEAERISSSAQQELAVLIHALRPVPLADKGLSVALRETCHDWSERTHISSDIAIEDGLALAPLAEQEVFRIMQETLSNVARHSGATQVEVRAQRRQDILALSIQDNGHGFDTTQAEGKGLGLRSMRERIAGVNGTVRIYSTASGTRVEIRIPLPANPPAQTSNGVAVGSHLES